MFKDVIDFWDKTRPAGDKWSQTLKEDSIFSHVNWAIKTLKRQDRIIWYLRWIKLEALDLVRYHALEKDRELKEYKAIEKSFKRLGARLANGAGMKISTVGGRQERGETEPGPDEITWSGLKKIKNHIINRVQTNIEHFLSMEIPKVQDYEWKWQSWNEIRGTFRVYEDEWKAKFDGLIPIEEDDQIIMEFPDGKAWLFLDRWECPAEGNAMGHCGNAAGESGDRILSMRSRTEVDGEPMWRVHLTFILGKDGWLGEMKGQGNSRPKAEYHPHIIALLKSSIETSTNKKEFYDPDWDETQHGAQPNTPTESRDITIKGIRGGGYMPENNFSLSDIEDEETKKELMELKPDLASLMDHYKMKGMTRQLIKMVEDKFNSNDLSLDYDGHPNSGYLTRIERRHDSPWGWEVAKLSSAQDVSGWIEVGDATKKEIKWVSDLIYDPEYHSRTLDIDVAGDLDEIQTVLDLLPPNIVHKIIVYINGGREEADSEIIESNIGKAIYETVNDRAWNIQIVFTDALSEGYRTGQIEHLKESIQEFLGSWGWHNIDDDDYTLVVSDDIIMKMIEAIERGDYNLTWGSEFTSIDGRHQYSAFNGYSYNADKAAVLSALMSPLDKVLQGVQ
jgi:hypothetical protein